MAKKRKLDDEYKHVIFIMAKKRKLDKKLEHICEKCHLIAGKDINEITGGFWCPTCPVVLRKKEKYVQIPTHEKSLATFDNLKMSRWGTEKNKTTPDQVFKKTNTVKYFFNCAECKHDFDIRPCHMVRKSWCPFCKDKRLCKNDCKSCFDKSLASIKFPRGLSWVEGQTILDKSSGTMILVTLRDVFKGANKEYYDIKCDKCGHILEKKPLSLKDEKGCPYCSSRKRCDDEIVENCSICMKGTFANFVDTQKVAAWLDKNLPTRPCHVAISQNNPKFIFMCFNPECLK